MTEKLYANPEPQNEFELGQASESDDSGDADDPDATYSNVNQAERRALVTQPVDMELDSIYSESERDSMASSLRPGESPGTSLPTALNVPGAGDDRDYEPQSYND